MQPQLIFAGDVAALSALLLVRHFHQRGVVSTRSALLSWRHVLPTVATLVACGVGSAYLGSASVTTTFEDELTPQSWVGKPFPLLAHTTIDRAASKGTWMLLLYRPSCLDCRDVLPVLSRIAIASSHVRFAFLDISSASEVPAKSGASQASPVYGRITGRQQYPLRTPIIVRMHNTVVENVWVGKEARKLVNQLAEGLELGCSDAPFQASHPREPSNPGMAHASFLKS